MMKKYFLFILLLAVFCLPAYGQTVRIAIPDTDVSYGKYVTIPVRILDDMTGMNVVAYQLQLHTNPSLLAYDSLLTSGTMTGIAAFAVNAGSTSDGTISVAAAGTTALKASGVLLYLRFRILNPGYTGISFGDPTKNIFNEGSPAMDMHSGTLSIEQPSEIHLSPGSAEMSVGETAQFSVYDGTSPYSWSVVNPDIVSVTQDGLVTALKAGKTKLSVKDANGVMNNASGDIDVRACKLTIVDSTVAPGTTVDIPVYITSVNGLGIISGTFTVYYSPQVLTLLDVVKTGTLLDAYTKPVILIKNNGVIVSFAGSVPLSGKGVLLYLHMQVSGGSESASTGVIPADALFNESLEPKLVGGTYYKQSSGALGISYNQSKFAVGDTLRFYPYGGFPPYSFSISNNQVASMDASGLFMAKSGGKVQVKLKDSGGDSLITDALTVYDMKAFMRDTSIAAGNSFELPVYIDRVPAANPISSFEMRIFFDTALVSFTGVGTANSLTNGWSVASYQQGYYLKLAGASSGQVKAGGKFLRLQFLLKNTVSGGTDLSIYPDQLLMNEGNPWCDFNGAIIHVMQPLEAPSGFTAKAIAPGKVLLSWTDNSSDETGFILQRKTGDTLSADIYADIDTLAANQTSFTDTTVASQTLYSYRVYAFNSLSISGYSNQGKVLTMLSSVNGGNHYPKAFALEQNFPNPFNPSTLIRFDLASTERVSLRIYNILGKEIATLINNETRPAGVYEVTFNASAQPSGMYLYRLDAGSKTFMKKMLLLK